jgi:hypothetical protein
MIVLVALTTGLVFWIAGWAFGMKPVDAFLVTALLVLVASAVRIVSPFLDEALGRERPS